MADEKLEKLRKEINEIDYRFLEKFTDLWNAFLIERGRMVKEIREYKKTAELDPVDGKREREVISDRADRGHRLTNLPRQLLEDIWKRIIDRTK